MSYFFFQWIWKFIHNTAQWKSNFPVTPATKHIFMTQHFIAILAMPKQKRGEKGEDRNDHLYELETQNVPSKSELHYESIFFNVKMFSNGPKKDGKYFLLTNIIRLANIAPISIVFPPNALSFIGYYSLLLIVSRWLHV